MCVRIHSLSLSCHALPYLPHLFIGKSSSEQRFTFIHFRSFSAMSYFITFYLHIYICKCMHAHGSSLYQWLWLWLCGVAPALIALAWPPGGACRLCGGSGKQHRRSSLFRRLISIFFSFFAVVVVAICLLLLFLYTNPFLLHCSDVCLQIVEQRSSTRR